MTQESVETTPLTRKTLQNPIANRDGFRTTLPWLGILVATGIIVVARFLLLQSFSSSSTQVEDDWIPEAIVSDYTMPISIFDNTNEEKI